MQKYSFLILVVTYGKNLAESDTLKGLLSNVVWLNENNAALHIHDNSPIDHSTQYKRLFFEVESAYYRWTPENIPLPKIYNLVLDQYENKFDYFVNLDDDSFITPKYFQELTKLSPDALLSVPLVMCSGEVISPGKYIGCFGFGNSSRKTGLRRARHIMAITSGMVVSHKVFSKLKVRYNESLTLYGVDTDFVLRLRKLIETVNVLDVEIKHGSALKQVDRSTQSYMTRMENRFSAWRTIHKGQFWVLIVEMKIIVARLRLRLK